MNRLCVPLAVVAVALVSAVPAEAKSSASSKASKAAKKSKKKAKKKAVPTISKVSPMRVGVGKSLTLRGKTFSGSRRANTVVFIAPSGRVAFGVAAKASGRKLVVKVPSAVRRLLPVVAGQPVPTRFSVRVISRKKYGKPTSKRLSPIITATGVPPVTCKAVDCDGDGLSNAREATLKTDPSLKDTDGDGAEDGFEVESALLLNQRAVPYPAKRPWPNALYPDGGNDYDGDGLSNAEESAAWAHPAQGALSGGLQSYVGAPYAPDFGGPYGGQAYYGNHTFPLTYSDGSQTTSNVVSGISPEYRASLDTDLNGSLDDDERDADGDGIGNIEEIRGLMVQSYYEPVGNCTATGNDYSYKPLLPREFTPVNWLDSDSDGDGILDGNDDQDNDDVSNVDEIRPPYQDCSPADDGVTVRGPVGSTGLRGPFNPCLPYQSRACHKYVGK